ncbi:hypothetical protein CPT75_11340 [Butyrivibrio fibrisolvens]|uniref:Uncharacterized protein n=1 Tax=Butyrivibrio fibrisolvens TaxID=831 RepID=A0A317G0Z7_BUTFI|nr:hypothetical protein CPT75_11340 [Butyrivibrio fibrisolvens]
MTYKIQINPKSGKYAKSRKISCLIKSHKKSDYEKKRGNTGSLINNRLSSCRLRHAFRNFVLCLYVKDQMDTFGDDAYGYIDGYSAQ